MDGASGATELSLRERRVLFSKLLAQLIQWVNDLPGMEIALDEGPIHSPRPIRTNGQVSVQKYPDGVHKANSYHYLGLAQDLLLYINGQYESDGDHPAWRAIAEKWESLDPACTSGARWKDVNHVSLGEGDRSRPLPWLV